MPVLASACSNRSSYLWLVVNAVGVWGKSEQHLHSRVSLSFRLLVVMLLQLLTAVLLL